MTQKEKQWERMTFDELYSEWLNNYDSALADYLDNYYYSEFAIAEKERRDEERELAELDSHIQKDY